MTKIEPPFPFSQFVRAKGPPYQISPVFKNFLYHPLNFFYFKEGKLVERMVERIDEIDRCVFKEWTGLGVKFFNNSH